MENHAFVAVWRVHPYSGGCTKAGNVVIIQGNQQYGIVLEGEDQTKLRYLTVVIAASKMSGKSSYMAWLWFFDEGMAIGVVTSWMTSWQTGSPCMCYQVI